MFPRADAVNYPHGPLFRADLHVHSRYSSFPHLGRIRVRSSYSSPAEIYHTAKERGMDLVTITDHDTIDGCREVLDRLGDLPDFMISEEVESFLPDTGRKIHLNVFDISEEEHGEIQRLRGDFDDLCGYLREKRILASFNHFIDTFACAALPEPLLEEILSRFDLFEVRDGARHASYNRVMERILWEARHSGLSKGLVGGSNAHTLRRIGTTYTASPARTRKEFLRDLRRGATLAFGADGTTLGMAGDVYGVLLRFYGSLLPGGWGDLAPAERIRGLAVSLLTSPLHLLFPPLLLVRIHFSRIRKTLREVQRRLDDMDVLAFRSRVKDFPACPSRVGWPAWPGRDAADSEAPFS